MDIAIDSNKAPIPGGDMHIMEVTGIHTVIHRYIMEDSACQHKGHSGKGGYVIVLADHHIAFVALLIAPSGKAV